MSAEDTWWVARDIIFALGFTVLGFVVGCLTTMVTP